MIQKVCFHHVTSSKLSQLHGHQLCCCLRLHIHCWKRRGTEQLPFKQFLCAMTYSNVRNLTGEDEGNLPHCPFPRLLLWEHRRSRPGMRCASKSVASHNLDAWNVHGIGVV